MRVKVEVNTHERSPARPLVQHRFSVGSAWFDGSADVQTFQPEELVPAAPGCRSRTSSERSSVLGPSFSPSSTSAWCTQLRRQLLEIPRSCAIWATFFARSRASSTARWWNSGGAGVASRTPRRMIASVSGASGWAPLTRTKVIAGSRAVQQRSGIAITSSKYSVRSGKSNGVLHERSKSDAFHCFSTDWRGVAS